MIIQLNTERERISQAVRLVLVLVLLLVFWITSAAPLAVVTYISLAAYAVYSAILIGFGSRMDRVTETRAAHWIDVAFFVYLVAITRGSNSAVLFLSFFAVLIASFRWGYAEGLRVTVACASMFTLVGVIGAPAGDRAAVNLVLLRPLYLLPIGYLMAYWGGTELRLQQWLGLLQSVRNTWNPRFGINHTIGSNLDRLVAFYGARSCILVLRQGNTAQRLLMYTAMPGRPGASMSPREITADTAARLLYLPETCGVLHSQAGIVWNAWAPRTRVYELETRTRTADPEGCADLAALLEVDCFVSVPYSQRDGTVGRIFLTADRQIFLPSDVFFLARLSSALSAIAENMFLMDELISRATEHERLNVSRDIHDTTIQPYIGVKLALEALLREVPADGVIARRVNEIIDMVSSTVRGLRTYANDLRAKTVVAGEFLVAAVKHEAEHLRRFYGLEVELVSQITEQVSGRVAAEAFQIISEGLSNVLKHSDAKRARVEITCAGAGLVIRIRNQAQRLPVAEFSPRSIIERAESLKGTTVVETGADGYTTVEVTIPNVTLLST